MKTNTRTNTTKTTRHKKFIFKILKMNNAIDPAAPASVWGKGVPGKGGNTTNYDHALPDPVIWAKIYGRKAVAKC